MGGSGNDCIAGIAHDPTTDNLYIAGGVTTTTDFGGGATSMGSGVAAFVAGYGPAGNYLWLKTWGGIDSFAQDSAGALAVDQDGNLAVTGATKSWIDFGDGALPGGGYTTVSFTLAGNSPPVYRWAKRANYGQSTGTGLAFDGRGHVVTCGGLLSWVDFGGVRGIVTQCWGAFVAQHMK